MTEQYQHFLGEVKEGFWDDLSENPASNRARPKDETVVEGVLGESQMPGLTTKNLRANAVLGLPDGSGPRHKRQELIPGRA